jgi:hypothetical protein
VDRTLMRRALHVARELALLGWEYLQFCNDLSTCRLIGCDWKWQDTTNGPICACARSGCTPPTPPRG